MYKIGLGRQILSIIAYKHGRGGGGGSPGEALDKILKETSLLKHFPKKMSQGYERGSIVGKIALCV